MKFENENNALDEFVKACLVYDKCQRNGDYKNGNKAHDIIYEVFHYLKKEGMRERFKDFFNHENSSVRLWSTAFLLNTNLKDEAINNMKSIIEENGFYSFSAKLTLEEWNNGNLTTIN